MFSCFVNSVYCSVFSVFVRSYRKLRRGSQLMLQAGYGVFGFRWKLIGKQADQSEASVFVCAPHSTLIDAGIMILLDTIPYAVTREENSKIPIIGSMLLWLLVLGKVVPRL